MSFDSSIIDVRKSEKLKIGDSEIACGPWFRRRGYIRLERVWCRWSLAFISTPSAHHEAMLEDFSWW